MTVNALLITIAATLAITFTLMGGLKFFIPLLRQNRARL